MYGLITYHRGKMRDAGNDIYHILENNLANNREYATYGNEKNSLTNLTAHPEVLDYIFHKSKSGEISTRTVHCEIQEDEFKSRVGGELRSLSDHSPLFCTIRLQGKYSGYNN